MIKEISNKYTPFTGTRLSALLHITTAIITIVVFMIQADESAYIPDCSKVKQKIRTDSISHPEWPDHFVYLFRPISSIDRLPVVLFCHGIGANNPSIYDGLISQIVARGCAVIYSPFRSSLTNPNKCYSMMWSGFENSVKKWCSELDTTRMGFVGHSYGGGAVPGLAHKALTEYHWGSQASFLYIMAPWFSHWISQADLTSFPSDTRLVMQIFENDRINDPRMALDIYNTINIPSGNKHFIFTHNDTCNGAVLKAGHDLPEGKCSSASFLDTFFHFGFSRIVDALTSHIKAPGNTDPIKSLKENIVIHQHLTECQEAIDKVATSAQQTDLFINPEICYVNFWHHAMNPRAGATLNMLVHCSPTRVRSATTVSNYLWMLFYPSMLRAQEEELTEHFSQWEEDIEYRDTSVFTQMVQMRSRNYTRAPGPIASGCGAHGPFGIVQRFIPNSGSGKGKLHILLPQGGTGPYPLIYFTPNSSTSSTKYRELLFLMASQGYIVVASTSNNKAFSSHRHPFNSLQEEFEMCNLVLTGLIDTSRIGFITHSSGTLPLLHVADTYLNSRQWGANGSFIFLMSPDFRRCVRRIDLQCIPPQVWTGIQVFEEHTTREKRVAYELFNGLSLPDSQKIIMLVNSFVAGYHEVEADRNSPRCEERDDETNCVDDYGIFRPLCTIAAHAFKLKTNANCREESLSGISQYYVEFKGCKWFPITRLY